MMKPIGIMIASSVIVSVAMSEYPRATLMNMEVPKGSEVLKLEGFALWMCFLGHKDQPVLQ